MRLLISVLLSLLSLFVFLLSCSVWVRVVSMPCLDIFQLQSQDYQLSVFPKGAPVMSIEPASTNAWRRYAHAPFGEDPSLCACVDWLVLFDRHHLGPAQLESSVQQIGVSSYAWLPLTHLPKSVFTDTGIVNSFGLSAPAEKIYDHFGFTVPNLTTRANDVIAFYTPAGAAHPVAPSLIDVPVFPSIQDLHIKVPKAVQGDKA